MLRHGTAPEHRDVPVLALTGFGRPEDIERAKQAGFYCHITKPFDFDNLTTTLQKLPVRRTKRTNGNRKAPATK
jgi:CheY-like chemotaxis protein